MWTCDSRSAEEAQGVESHPPEQVTNQRGTGPGRSQWMLSWRGASALAEPSVTRGEETILGMEASLPSEVSEPWPRSRSCAFQQRAGGLRSQAGPEGLVSMRSTDGGMDPGPKSKLRLTREPLPALL